MAASLHPHSQAQMSLAAQSHAEPQLDSQTQPKQLFIAWVPFQRRAATMQANFGYALHHIGLSWKSRWLRPLEYCVKACQTLMLLFQHRPDVLWIQLPPAPLLYLALLYRSLCQPSLRIIADCHNATFRRPWVQFPGAIVGLNRCDRVVIHNPWVKNQAIELGIEPEQLHVLRDQTMRVDPNEQLSAQALSIAEIIPVNDTPWVLVPCSFNCDEPIAELFEAARLVPDLTFIVTGNPSRAKGRHCLSKQPDNLKLVGFVSDEEFRAMLAQAHAIVGLTKLEGIQLSVANEALSFGRPMVLSQTELLRDFFPKGAVYVDPLDPAAIAQGCCTALNTAEALTSEAKTLQEEVAQQWTLQAEPLYRWLIRVA